MSVMHSRVDYVRRDERRLLRLPTTSASAPRKEADDGCLQIIVNTVLAIVL